MDLSGERLIEGPESKCLGGFERPGNSEKSASLAAEPWKNTRIRPGRPQSVTLGAIATLFTGTVLLSDIDPPNGYTISFKAEGPEGGPIKGGAKIAL